MLRNFLIGIGGVLLVVGALALLAGFTGAGLVSLAWGAILVLLLVYERHVYKPVMSRPPGPEWVRTDERFVDEKIGKTVTVYIKPLTGERAYVAE